MVVAGMDGGDARHDFSRRRQRGTLGTPEAAAASRPSHLLWILRATCASYAAEPGTHRREASAHRRHDGALLPVLCSVRAREKMVAARGALGGVALSAHEAFDGMPQRVRKEQNKEDQLNLTSWHFFSCQLSLTGGPDQLVTSSK